MGNQVTVTNAQFEALVAKLDSLQDSFTEDERTALDALVALAGDGIAAHAQPEVSGFGGGLWSGAPAEHFSLNFTMPTDQKNQGILIGLLRNGSANMQDFHFNTPGASSSH